MSLNTDALAGTLANGHLEQPSLHSSSVFHRDLRHKFYSLVSGEGGYLLLNNGRKIFDGSGGASVASIGHGNQRVAEAAMKQMMNVAYCSTTFYTTEVCEELCRYLVDSTNGKMARAYIVSSGRFPSLVKVAPKLIELRVRGHGGCIEACSAILS
jgi:adenosylmethionine-8-amino-7-oxononanoate aminotransferase